MATGKQLTDLRGPQRRIGRLLHFYFEAYLHMLSYRIIIPLVILYAPLIVIYLFVPGVGPLLKVWTLVLWAIWAPQFAETAKGLALSWSRGMVYGHLNEEFAALYRKRYPHWTGGYRLLPFLALGLWIAGFIVLIVGWHP